MKKRRIWALLLALIMVITSINGYPINVIAASSQQSKVQEATKTEYTLPLGDLQFLKEKRITTKQAAKVPDYTDANMVSTFAISRNSYASTYGYETLATGDSQKIYKLLENAAYTYHNSSANATPDKNGNYAFKITLENINYNTNDLYKVVGAFYYDHPEFYWLDSYGKTTSNGYVKEIVIYCHNDYKEGATRSSLQATMDTEINKYLDLVVGVNSDYEKELIIHDELVNRLSYSYNSSNEPSTERWAHSIVGVFDGKTNKVVCEGYAKAFQLLMNACGIECIYVPGNATANSTTSGHAWNQVKLGGNWYNVDVTWDDPVSDSGPKLSHDYFNVTDSQFSDHTKGSISSTIINEYCYNVNSCTATEYQYKAVNTTDKFKLSYDQPGNGSLKLYNRGIELVTNSQVASGTAITVEATPTDQTNTYVATCTVNDVSITMTEDTSNAESKKYKTSITMPEKDTTIKVELTPKDKLFTITFDSNGGSEIPPMKDIKEGSTITTELDKPTYKGYQFMGWYIDPAFTNEFSSSMTITSNITLYAKWQAAELKRITAEYKGNSIQVGKELNKTDIEVFAYYTDGTKVSVPATSFDVDKSIINLEGSNEITVSYGTKTATIIVYGYAQVGTYIVTFDSMGGSSVSPISNIKEGECITFPENPKRNEYYFAGWYTQKSCTTQFMEVTPITGNITLYAKWIPLLSDPNNTISKIEATYSGDNVIVGNVVDKSKIKVYVTDKNGVKHTTTNYSLSTMLINKTGVNTLTVTYGGFSTTINVTGIPSAGSGTTVSKYVTFISAGYNGAQVEVGSKVERTNITLVAAYNDNSVSFVTDFYISNDTITTVGNNTIYVYYSGYTTTVTVVGVPKGSLTTTTPVQPTTTTSVVTSSSSISTSTASSGYSGYVTPKITVTTSENYATVGVEIEESVMASAVSGKNLSNTNILQLTIGSVNTQVYNQLNKSAVNNVYVNVCIPIQYYGRNDIQISDIVLDSLTLTKLKSSGKSVVVQYIGSSYSSDTDKVTYTEPLCSMELKGSDITSTTYSNLALRVTSLTRDYEIESGVNDYLNADKRGNGIVVTYGKETDNNETGYVTVDVGGSLGKEKGDDVYIYGYNTSTKKLEELLVTKYKVDKNQKIVFKTSKYSKYVILPDETDNPVVSIASQSKVTKKIAIKKSASKQISITLPKNVTKNDVTIKYESSNRKTAYVSKTGRVYAKKKGKAVITTTITYGKYSKKYTTTITVK